MASRRSARRFHNEERLRTLRQGVEASCACEDDAPEHFALATTFPRRVLEADTDEAATDASEGAGGNAAAGASPGGMSIGEALRRQGIASGALLLHVEEAPGAVPEREAESE